MTVIKALRDLHKQATVERSHYYTGRVINEAIAEIERLTRERDEWKEKWIALGQAALAAGTDKAQKT